MRAVVISDPSGRACNNSGSLKTVLLRIVLEKGRSGAFAGGLVDGDPSFLEVGHWLRNISLRVSPNTRWKPSGSGLSGIAACRSLCHRRAGSISTIQVSSSKPVPITVSTYSALTVIGNLIIYTVDVLDYPFDDNLQVGPGAFEMVLGSIEESGSRGSRTSTLSKRPERGVSGVERCRLSIAGEVAQRER
jgi:hypothetical protein